jgi:hypothetical protein
VRLFIGIPSNRDHSPHFVASLVAMVQISSVNGIEPRKLEDLRVNIKTNCSNIATARNDLVQEAIDANFTHILFLDDDMTFPFDILDHLCKYDCPVVAANCCQKRDEITFTAIGLDGKRLDSRGKTGYEQVRRAGTGIMLIDLAIFATLPKPWFNFEWNSESQKMIGEDYYFCRMLNRNDIPIIVDHDVSQHIGHVGSYTYGLGKSCLVPRPLPV